jgi:23S rRNA (guanosine2251-2'-O)-methyltransferase
VTSEWIYGRNPVREAIAAGRRPVHEVWAIPGLADEPWLPPLSPHRTGRAEIGRVCGTADHQGVAARVGPYPYAEADEVLARPGPVICLDGAQDPRNVGAVARIADAAGAAGMVLVRRGGAGVTPVASKTSAGAVEHLRVARVDNLAAFLHDARGGGRWAVGADAEGGEDYRRIDWDRDVLLVMGAEGTGLRPRVRSMCDRLARIPMEGNVGSLNLAVAAGILLFAARDPGPGEGVR